MLHIKFRENRPAVSGEEDFGRVLTIYGRGGHLGQVTQMPRTKYRSPYYTVQPIIQMFVPNFKILGQVVPEKSLTKISIFISLE